MRDRPHRFSIAFLLLLTTAVGTSLAFLMLAPEYVLVAGFLSLLVFGEVVFWWVIAKRSPTTSDKSEESSRSDSRPIDPMTDPTEGGV